jgi:hypothetical protein
MGTNKKNTVNMKKKIFILDDSWNKSRTFKNNLENHCQYEIVFPKDKKDHDAFFKAIKTFFDDTKEDDVKKRHSEIIQLRLREINDVDGFILDYELSNRKYLTCNSEIFFNHFGKDDWKEKPVLVISGLTGDVRKRTVDKFVNILSKAKFHPINDKWSTPDSLIEFVDICKSFFETETKERIELVIPKESNIKKMKKIFISYSRRDVDFKDELKRHLGILSVFDIVDIWSCEEITLGTWNNQIQKELEDSNIIIYMLSANFFSSPYILEREVQNVIEGKKGNKKILCVIVSEFVNLDKIEDLLSKNIITDKQKAILALKTFQYLPYGKEFNNVTKQNEEKIMSLKQYSNGNEIEVALKQIVSKIIDDLK